MIERDDEGNVTPAERDRLRDDAAILRLAAAILTRRGWEGDGEITALECWANHAEWMASSSRPA